MKISFITNNPATNVLLTSALKHLFSITAHCFLEMVRKKVYPTSKVIAWQQRTQHRRAYEAKKIRDFASLAALGRASMKEYKTEP
jgi:hypothetical protein